MQKLAVTMTIKITGTLETMEIPNEAKASPQAIRDYLSESFATGYETGPGETAEMISVAVEFLP